MMLRRANARAGLLGALAMVLVPFGPAIADQNDPKLDELFTELNRLDTSSAKRSEIRELEQEIWGVWYETDNKATRSYLMLGDQAMSRGNISFAIGAFAQAIDNSPEMSEAWNRRATAYYMVSQFEKSLADVDRVIELEPRHFGALSGAGQIYMEMGETEKAIEALERALKVNPHMAGPKIAIERLKRQLEEESI